MIFKIDCVDIDNFEDTKVSKRYKEILNKYNYFEDEKYSYIKINTINELISLEKQLTLKNGFRRGIIIRGNTITIYDDYIE